MSLVSPVRGDLGSVCVPCVSAVAAERFADLARGTGAAVATVRGTGVHLVTDGSSQAVMDLARLALANECARASDMDTLVLHEAAVLLAASQGFQPHALSTWAA